MKTMCTETLEEVLRSFNTVLNPPTLRNPKLTIEYTREVLKNILEKMKFIDKNTPETKSSTEKQEKDLETIKNDLKLNKEINLEDFTRSITLFSSSIDKYYIDRANFDVLYKNCTETIKCLEEEFFALLQKINELFNSRDEISSLILEISKDILVESNELKYNFRKKQIKQVTEKYSQLDEKSRKYFEQFKQVKSKLEGYIINFDNIFNFYLEQNQNAKEFMLKHLLKKFILEAFYNLEQKVIQNNLISTNTSNEEDHFIVIQNYRELINVSNIYTECYKLEYFMKLIDDSTKNSEINCTKSVNLHLNEISLGIKNFLQKNELRADSLLSRIKYQIVVCDPENMNDAIFVDFILKIKNFENKKGLYPHTTCSLEISNLIQKISHFFDQFLEELKINTPENINETLCEFLNGVNELSEIFFRLQRSIFVKEFKEYLVNYLEYFSKCRFCLKLLQITENMRSNADQISETDKFNIYINEQVKYFEQNKVINHEFNLIMTFPNFPQHLWIEEIASSLFKYKMKCIKKLGKKNISKENLLSKIQEIRKEEESDLPIEKQ